MEDRMRGAVTGGKIHDGKREGVLFLKKKNQKDFISSWSQQPNMIPNRKLRRDESLFASFSSEKEDSSFPLAAGAFFRPNGLQRKSTTP